MDCEKDGCVRRVFSRNLCHKHYEEERLANAPPCEIDGCEAKAERRGMCNKHYRQQKLATSPPCSVPGCGRPSFVGGHCQTHHKRIQRYGSLEADVRAFDRGAREKHPLYKTWCWHRRQHSMCESWSNDFWAFTRTVGDRPSEKHRLLRKDLHKKIGPGNWKWLQTIEARDRSERMRKYRKLHPEKFRRYHLNRRRLGFDLDSYNEMHERQGHVCAICKQPEVARGNNGTTSELAVDHCHETNEVRGLLCSKCNRGLGFFNDDPRRLSAAMKYLEKSRKK